MMEISIHPNVYKTGQISGLLSALETSWVRGHIPGDGTLYAISGFANYNGGVRFYDILQNHVDKGGAVVAIFGGSNSQKLTSKQVVRKLLECGVNVHIVNRKRLLHMKCYGAATRTGQNLIVSSGNFTGPGMSQNVEMSIFVDNPLLSQANFSWENMVEKILAQNWDIYRPPLDNLQHPAWKLLYDEQDSTIKLNDTDEVTLILILGHSDTARIMANNGDEAAKGTQYFWLSKDCFDFFPPLTILNKRGYKPTYSAAINIHYIDLDVTHKSRVTFEAANNLDFRLGTGTLRYSKIANEKDIAAISRIGENDYELRIVKAGTPLYKELKPYANTFIGHRGKKYGFMTNQTLANILNVKIGSRYPNLDIS